MMTDEDIRAAAEVILKEKGSDLDVVDFGREVAALLPYED